MIVIELFTHFCFNIYLEKQLKRQINLTKCG